MDLPQSGHRKQEDARAEDSAIMLFGKQIKNLSNAEKIKEELSPRGVDEKGLSFATSSDDDEDLYPACEDAMHVMQSASTPMGSVLASETSREHAKKRKAIESECVVQDTDAEKPKSIAAESTEGRMGGDNHVGKVKGSIWSRCPRCNSADTKFCYFNNYNVNQPRHFCKHCQRYWTAGGTLRNVPIGAGKRKNKHALHKHGFVANSASATSSMPMGVSDPEALPIVKPDPESGPLPIIKSEHVNTNLELSAHHPFMDPAMPTLPPCNIIHPHSAQKLITLHQLHENLQSRLSQLNHPHECSKFGQIYPNLACGPSSLSPIHPELASGGRDKLSQGHPDSEVLSQVSPFLHNGLYGLSQVCPHLHGEFPGLSQICPDLQSGSSEFARSGPHLQSGFCRSCYPCPHVQSGSCKTSQECLDCKRKELSGLANKSERGLSEIDEVKRNLESELPMSDQKSASLERGLPDMVRTAAEKSKASSLQIGHHEVDPNEVEKYMQRLNEMKSIASNEYKAHMRGACHGTVEIKAPPVCVQGDHALISSTSAPMIKSQEASNIENLETRGIGEGHNSLLNIWGGLWPYFYNMFWLDPLAFSHFRPILTPQGWALPFIPPSAPKVEPTSYSPHNIRPPTTYVSKNFDSSSTLTASSTPTTLLTPFEDVCNGAYNIDNISLGRHLVQTPNNISPSLKDISPREHFVKPPPTT